MGNQILVSILWARFRLPHLDVAFFRRQLLAVGGKKPYSMHVRTLCTVTSPKLPVPRGCSHLVRKRGQLFSLDQDPVCNIQHRYRQGTQFIASSSRIGEPEEETSLPHTFFSSCARAPAANAGGAPQQLSQSHTRIGTDNGKVMQGAACSVAGGEDGENLIAAGFKHVVGAANRSIPPKSYALSCDRRLLIRKRSNMRRER